MVKVKAKDDAGKVATKKMSQDGFKTGKKKKQKKVLKVVTKRNNGTTQPAASLKGKKKRKRRKKANKGVAEHETPSETMTKEDVPQESGSEKEENDEKNKKAPSSSTDVDSQKDGGTQEGTSMAASKPTEPEDKNLEAQGSGEKESVTQGKKKKKRKNKRKASEALEDEDNATGTAEQKDGEENLAGKKKSKRQKLEKKEGEGSTEDVNAESNKSKMKQEKKHVLFIGNLPFDATEEEVREHFKVVGDDIVRITLMSRQKTALGKGYGFLELSNATAYNAALKLNLSQFKDRKINVEYTVPGKKTKQRQSFIKLKTKKLLGQKKGRKGKKKGSRKH